VTASVKLLFGIRGDRWDWIYESLYRHLLIFQLNFDSSKNDIISDLAIPMIGQPRVLTRKK
jgi:hypothetical protein